MTQMYGELDPATLAVRDLVAASRELVGRMARRMAMNANDMSAIDVLMQHGPMGASELADHLGIRSASATAMVDRLERAGHVERVRDTVDRRRVTITETEIARRAAYDAWSPLIEDINDVCLSFPAAERAIVAKVLTRLTEVVETGGRS